MTQAEGVFMGDNAHRTSSHVLRLKRLGIDTYQEPVIYMRSDCHVCRAEGFEAQSRVQVAHNNHAIVATLNVVTGDLLAPDEAGLSEVAWRLLGARAGDAVALSHPPVLDSLSRVRAKLYGKRLGDADMRAIVGDVAAGRYADIYLSAFIAACAGDRLDLAETVALTRAMIDAGERLAWGRAPVVDKHCVGGLPGNRTTLIVVPIVAAFGLTMPKTSSRAITSPAGIADVMETLTEVELDVPAMRRVVEREGGCIVWGGTCNSARRSRQACRSSRCTPRRRACSPTRSTTSLRSPQSCAWRPNHEARAASPSGQRGACCRPC